MMAISYGSTFDQPVDKRPWKKKKPPPAGPKGAFGVLRSLYVALKP
jgi:hypothetical protein